jgi:hypothetical protein
LGELISQPSDKLRTNPMVVCSPSLTEGLHADKKNEIQSMQSRDISSPNLGVVNSSQTYGRNSIISLEWIGKRSNMIANSQKAGGNERSKSIMYDIMSGNYHKKWRCDERLWWRNYCLVQRIVCHHRDRVRTRLCQAEY